MDNPRCVGVQVDPLGANIASDEHPRRADPTESSRSTIAGAPALASRVSLDRAERGLTLIGRWSLPADRRGNRTNNGPGAESSHSASPPLTGVRKTGVKKNAVDSFAR
jgi:hypothetical protein